MKAFVYAGPGAYEIQDVPVPHVLKSNQVRIRIDMASICGSDMLILQGTHPAKPGVILGH